MLVVDDNEVNRRILEEMLTTWEMRTTTVGGAETALELMHRASEVNHPFPLVILDAQMPGMDGFSMAERIKADPVARECRDHDAEFRGPELGRSPMPRSGHQHVPGEADRTVGVARRDSQDSRRGCPQERRPINLQSAERNPKRR